MSRFLVSGALLALGLGVGMFWLGEVSSPRGTLRHTAAFNFKAGVPQEMIDKILADAKAALPTIEGASNIVIGPQTNGLSKYKYGMSIDFKDRDAKSAYGRSQQSKRLHEQYKDYIEDEVIIDIVNQ